MVHVMVQEYKPCPASTFCLDVTPQEVARLPVLAFQLLGGPFLQITPHQYLESSADSGDPRSMTLYAPR